MVSCANSGFSPTMSGCSSVPMKASAWPTVGSRMSPRGSFGLGSSAMRRPKAPRRDVLAHEIDRFLVAVQGQPDVLGGLGLHSLAATPEDEDSAPSSAPSSVASQAFLTESRRTRGSLAVNAPSLKTGRQKRFVVTMGTCIPVASSARRKRFRISSRSLARRAVGDEIVVVEADAVGAQVGEPVHGVDRVEWRAHLGAERVTAGVAHRPEPEGEVVFGSRREEIGHGPPVVASTRQPVEPPPSPPRCPRQWPMIALSDREVSCLGNGTMLALRGRRWPVGGGVPR